MKIPPPPYPTSSEDLAARSTIHNQKWGPSDSITVEQLKSSLVNSQPADERLNLDLEATLAHERLSKDSFMSHELGLFYNDLYSASPIRPMGITSSDYLNHLFEPGDLVLVTEGNGECALWESQTSPAVGSYKTAFFPHALDPASLQNFEGTQGAVALSRMVSQFKYAAMRFGDDEAAHLFPEIIGRRLPVISVVSVGQWDSDMLFRVDAATHRDWNRACKRLSEIIRAQFGYDTKFKLQAPALLPSSEVEQRLMYFNPRLL